MSKTVRKGTPLLLWSKTKDVPDTLYERGHWFVPGYSWKNAGPSVMRVLQQINTSSTFFVHVFAPQQDVTLPAYTIDRVSLTALKLGNLLIVEATLPDVNDVADAACQKGALGLYIPEHKNTLCKEVFLCPRGIKTCAHIKTLSSSQFLERVKAESNLRNIKHAELASQVLPQLEAGDFSDDEDTVAPPKIQRRTPAGGAGAGTKPRVQHKPLPHHTPSTHYSTTPERRRRAALGLDPEDIGARDRAADAMVTQREAAKAEYRSVVDAEKMRDARLHEAKRLMAVSRMRRHMLRNDDDLDASVHGLQERMHLLKQRIHRDCAEKHKDPVHRDYCISNTIDDSVSMANELIRKVHDIQKAQFRRRGDLADELLRQWPCPELEPNKKLCEAAVRASVGFI